MHIITHNFDGHGRGIEVFKFQFAHATAVHGIGPLRVKGLDIKMFRPLAHLFIRRKGHTDITVRNIFSFQHRQCRHDLRDTRFVICPQQRFAIRGDQRLPEQLVQHREHYRRKHFVTYSQRNVTATVVFHNLRINMFTAKIRRGVDMGDKANRRNITGDVGRQRSHHSAFFAQGDIDQPHGLKLLFEQV